MIDASVIRTILFKRRIRINDLARLSGLSRGTVSAILNGRSCPQKTAQRIADALGVPLDEISLEGDF